MATKSDPSAGDVLDRPAAGAKSKDTRAAMSATLVIFGAGGDLTKRLIMPALCKLAKDECLANDFLILGLDRNDRSTEEWRKDLTAMRRESDCSMGAEEDQPWSWLMERAHYLQGDFTKAETFANLAQRVTQMRKGEDAGDILFYLAIADRLFGPVIEQIASSGLAKQSERSWRRIIVEKPFGHDLESARALNRQILNLLSEDQVYRIDHFLGKETVQNIMVMRFANGIFEPMWTREHIDHVQITAAEAIGVEGRGRFYEKTGALRDMVPNHLFQLLAMIAMEPPVSFDAESVRSKKCELFRAIHPVEPQNAIRGQYAVGKDVGQDQMRNYTGEPDVSPTSTTETYVALELRIDNWRWSGVPFFLRTGKHLAAHVTQISVHFRQAPYALFRDTPVERLPPNVLTLRLEPEEGLSASFNAKRPGKTIEIQGVEMNFSYRDYFPPLTANGYETLLYDCMLGDATLFQRADTVEAAWAAIQRLLDAWAAAPRAGLETYPSGGEGPKCADRLLARSKRSWAPIAAKPGRGD